MTTIDLLHYLHIIAFAVIIGIELPSLYALHVGANPNASAAARTLAIKVRRWTFALGGLVLVSFLPLGVSIAIDLGVYTLMDPVFLTATWIIAAVWLALVVAAEATGASKLARRLYTTEIWTRIIIGLGNVYDGVVGFLGTGMTQTNWLATKLVLFGLVLVVSGVLRWQTRPVRFAALEAGLPPGGGADVNALTMTLHNARWMSYAIIVMVLIAGWMGSIKPF